MFTTLRAGIFRWIALTAPPMPLQAITLHYQHCDAYSQRYASLFSAMMLSKRGCQRCAARWLFFAAMADAAFCFDEEALLLPA